ncbi:hypothetical protein FRC10_009636 [Ceratobasidium sp. 414]|nr:hypothetical protein FRC10_009636 [Ceratobasidium sp. 414]
MSDASISSATSTSDDSHENVVSVGIAASSYGTKQRRLLDLINRLHNTGIQSDIDLPQICVVGSQSAGKSSLIESISGVRHNHLNRRISSIDCLSSRRSRSNSPVQQALAPGRHLDQILLCANVTAHMPMSSCPTECRLAFSTGPWSCMIHLRFLKDENGDDISPIRNVPFGDVITNKDQVEERLRRAQLAILNPGVNASSFLGDKIPATSSSAVAFSENFVSVEITGPDVTNLSFCDLPGIIANVREGSDEGDIDLVKRLVTSYIRKDSCIILLTVTCETDYENQGARSLAKQYDPQGKRTIGVLTKPDRIEKGEEEKWLGFIRGETEVLSKGWFCVKQPSPSELEQNLTWQEARAREEEFFKTRVPWSSQMITVRQNFGTARLTSRLSEILSDQIAKRSLTPSSMPSLLSEIHRLNQSTIESLRALPDEISDDPAGAVLNLVMDFHREVSTHVEGIPDGDGLIQQIRTAQDKFRRSIRSSAPDFRPFKRPSNDGGKGNVPNMPVFAFLNEEEPTEAEEISDRTLFEDDVSKLSKQAVTRELPKNVPFIVKRKLINSFMEMWGEPTMALLEDVERILSIHMRRLVDSVFQQHSYGGLHNAVGAIVAERILGCREHADAQTQFALNIENNQTFTTNVHYLADYKEKFSSYYLSVRKAQQGENTFVKGLIEGLGAESDFSKSMGEVLAHLTKMGLSVEPQNLAKLLNSDPGEDVIDVMAEVRAYYQVAYKRFVDVIPMTVDETLVRGFSRGLEKRLFEGLGVSGDNAKEHCAAFLAHSNEITLERDMLKTRRDRLNLAKQEISNIWGS